MPTKTDRILSYLPGTFRPSPQRSALYALVDAFGSELLQAENSLAAIMQAHWVDHADRGAEVIDDLARIAALYGLAPRCQNKDNNGEEKSCRLPSRCDETVEEFREHLKRYIRTFLEGTVTVQGILRVTAETLGLRIADAYEEMDTWWDRPEDELVTVHPRGDDAAQRILGLEAVAARGRPACPAQLRGIVDLSGGIDLGEVAMLRLKVDDSSPVEINLAGGAADPTSITLGWIVVAINVALGDEIARHEGHFLTLTSTTLGSTSRLEVQAVANDAAEQILGLASHTYYGSEALAARVTGTIDLSDGADLSTECYLRLAIDRTQVVEIDCAGPNPVKTSLDQIQATINDALGRDVASHNGHLLTLTSPTTGFDSSIAFQQPAAQNAKNCLFGPVESFYLGQDDQPARLIGKRDLSGGVNLSERSFIQLSLDGAFSVSINCAGIDPINTRPGEIVTAINAAFGATAARHDGRFITLNSPTAGPDGAITLETPPTGDATEDIFGIGPRTFTGTPATAARITGNLDLSSGINLMAQNCLLMALDGGSPVELDLRAGATDPTAVTLDELTGAINDALGANIAAHDGQHLVLASPTTGNVSSLTINPLEVTRRRRFVTRAIITDEAAQAIFGFVAVETQGNPATSARLVGQADLSRGVDLRDGSYLRLKIGDQAAVDIDCAGKRPRATLIDEVVEKINTKLGMEIALHNDKNLVLISPSSGLESRIVIEPPQASDALNKLLGVEAGAVRGQDATKVIFTGAVDLSEGIELAAKAVIKLKLDSADSVQISLTEEEAASKTLNQIVIALNLALGINAASHDGIHLILSSAKSGTESQITFEKPAGNDITQAIFGITAPRSYQGADPKPAQVVGKPDLSAGVDLSVACVLKLKLDGGDTIEVDCAAQAADPTATTLGEIKEAINAAANPDTASHDGAHLILTAPTSGFSSRITLENHTSGEAREAILGTVPDETLGDAPVPAVITGEVDLLTSVDLEERRLIRLAVDGGRPVDINVAGAYPAATFLDEIVAAINAVFPGMASATADDRLQLTSPTSDVESRLALLPLRHLELIEYPPEPVEPLQMMVGHADRWSVVNDGAADTFAEIQFAATQGVVGPTLVNVTLGWRIRLLTILAADERVRLWRDQKRGLQLVIDSPQEETRPVPASEILVGPLGAQAGVPFKDTWSLTGNGANPTTLQLNNPLVQNLVRLRARQLGPAGHAITVNVTESELIAIDLESIAADGSEKRLVGRVRIGPETVSLVDAGQTVIAHLQAGPGVELAAYHNYVVAVTGPLHTGQPPFMVAQKIARLFEVALRFKLEGEAPIEEHYPGVTIGVDPGASDSLTWQINAGPQRSRLVTAEVWQKETVLSLPRGRSDWVYLDCRGDRFNEVNFNTAHFAGGICFDRAIFNISRFTNAPPESVKTVFASAEATIDPSTEIVFRRVRRRPGAFWVNLPADLPPRFGGRFNTARFGQRDDSPELYEKAVTEPPDDDDYLIALINKGRSLVEAAVVPMAPLEAIEMPFRRPQFLTLGDREKPARLYLSEEGVNGFIELKAREAGAWGNKIAVSARQSGPAMYDVCIIYQGSRFENARQVVRGEPLQPLVQDLLKPSPIGVLQAKAAGIQADVSRDRADQSAAEE